MDIGFYIYIQAVGVASPCAKKLHFFDIENKYAESPHHQHRPPC